MKPVKTILIVEDNPDDQLLALRALRKSGLACQIKVAKDGVEALEILQGGAAPANEYPSLVFLDLKLPRLTGLEVLQRLRSDPRSNSLPVVVLSSSGEEKDIEESYRLGANSYLRKPVDFNEFTETVRLSGVYWLEMNLLPAAHNRSRLNAA